MRGRLNAILEPCVLRRAEPITLLALRWLVGAFLVWGVWDNITSAARMSEFAAFLAAHGFPLAEWMAPLSVGAQFACGLAFVTGLGVRWAGLVCAFNFAVAIAMVDAGTGVRGSFPSACLIAVGLHLAARGGGPLGADSWLVREPR